MKLDFGGMTVVTDSRARELFETVYDSGEEQIYETKEVFQHEEEGLNFKYTYAVRVIDWGYATGEPEYENQFLVELQLVVHPDSLSEELAGSIMDCCGLAEDEFNVMDIISHGGGSVPMAHELVNEEYLEDMIDSAMGVTRAIDGMRGFFLDKPWNRIGTTGWDTVHYAVGERDNLF